MIHSTSWRPYHARIPPEDPDQLRGWLTRELMAIERALQPQNLQTAVSKGVATTPPLSMWAHTVIQVPFTGANNGTTFTDQKGNALQANGNAITSTANFLIPFGTSSGYFDGGSNTTSVTSTATADTLYNVPAPPEAWCVEGFFNTTQTGQQYTTLVGSQNAAFVAGSWALMLNANAANDGLLAFWLKDYSGAAALLTGKVNYADGKWHHAAVYTAANVWCLAVDGIIETAVTLRQNTSTPANLQLMFGNYPGFNRGFLGYLQEWRITRWVSPYPVVDSATPTTFTIPVVPFPTT